MDSFSEERRVCVHTICAQPKIRWVSLVLSFSKLFCSAKNSIPLVDDGEKILEKAVFTLRRRFLFVR